MTSNPPKRTAITWFIVAIVFAVMIVMPELVGLDGFDGGFALSFVSIIIACTAALVGVMYVGWAGQVDKILRGEGILAHWIYTPQFWAEYTVKEYKQEKSEKKGLFLMISAFALFFGVLFWILDTEAGFFVFLVMLGLIGLVGFTWRFTAWHTYRHNRSEGIKEAYITANAVFMNRRLYTWRAWFTKFDEVTLARSKGMTVLVFRYTTSGRGGTSTYTTRVPVPPGQEETAENVIQTIHQQNL